MACSVCAMAAFDYLMPPFGLWVLIIIVAFLGPIVIAKHFRVNIKELPSLTVAMIVLVFCFLAGAAFLGPALFLLLALLPIKIYFELLSTNKRSQWESDSLRAIKYFGIALLIIVTSTAIYTYKIKQTRTPAEFIVRWGSSGGASKMFEDLEKSEPQSLDQYRYIVDNGRGYHLATYQAAERIAAIGDPDIDEDRLIKLLERMRKENIAFSFSVEKVEKALTELRSRKVINKTLVQLPTTQQ